MIRLANYSPYKWIIYFTIRNLLQYDKNMKIIKVKHETRTLVHFFLRTFCKIHFKNICSTHHSDNTVLVSSEDTRAPTVRENLELFHEEDLEDDGAADMASQSEEEIEDLFCICWTVKEKIK